uniref:Uncharacterized protein n=1 Tax=Brassica oleracea var. oleracea TaxID=109376 RepID=A0A0D2ZUE4_BRAOL
MRHVSAISSFASSVPPLLQLFFTPDCLHTRSVSRDVLYDLDLAKHRISVCENNSDDNCISHQSQVQQQHRIVGVDLVDSEGDLVMAEGRDSV